MLDAATSAPSTSSTSTQSGPSRLPLTRYFTANKPSTNAFDLIEWEKRDVVMKDMDGEVIFEQLDVEVPKFWSLNATNIVEHQHPTKAQISHYCSSPTTTDAHAARGTGDSKRPAQKPPTSNARPRQSRSAPLCAAAPPRTPQPSAGSRK